MEEIYDEKETSYGYSCEISPLGGSAREREFQMIGLGGKSAIGGPPESNIKVCAIYHTAAGPTQHTHAAETKVRKTPEPATTMMMMASSSSLSLAHTHSDGREQMLLPLSLVHRRAIRINTHARVCVLYYSRSFKSLPPSTTPTTTTTSPPATAEPPAKSTARASWPASTANYSLAKKSSSTQTQPHTHRDRHHLSHRKLRVQFPVFGGGRMDENYTTHTDHNVCKLLPPRTEGKIRFNGETCLVKNSIRTSLYLSSPFGRIFLRTEFSREPSVSFMRGEDDPPGSFPYE